MVSTPESKKGFLFLSVVAWIVLLGADFLGILLRMQFPHTDEELMPSIDEVPWMDLAMSWVTLSPFIIIPAGLAIWKYSGSQNVFQFNRKKPIVAAISWLFFGGLAVACFFNIGETRHLSDLPMAFALLLLAYIYLCANIHIQKWGHP